MYVKYSGAQIHDLEEPCSLLAAIEPLTGRRIAAVYDQRRKKEFAQFCQTIVHAYPQTKKIRLVLDNLNTHDFSAFYENLPADESLALAGPFEFYFTPKSASWLNMIEIEFSALTPPVSGSAYPDRAKADRRGDGPDQRPKPKTDQNQLAVLP